MRTRTLRTIATPITKRDQDIQRLRRQIEQLNIATDPREQRIAQVMKQKNCSRAYAVAEVDLFGPTTP